MKNIFRITVYLVLILDFVKTHAAQGIRKEETALFQVKMVQTYTAQIEDNQESIASIPSKIYQKDVPINTLPGELLKSIFVLLDINYLGRVVQVSTRWKSVADDPGLWRYMGSINYGDYLSREDLQEEPKQKVVHHYLSVIVNATENLNETARLVCYYRLNAYTPLFTKLNVGFLLLLVDLSYHEEFVMKGNRAIIERKLSGLAEGNYGYGKDLIAARKFNDFLVEQGDPKAIERKHDGLVGRPHHVFQGDRLVPTGNRSRTGGMYFTNMPYYAMKEYGYGRDLVAARKFNEFLVEKGNQEAIKRKFEGLVEGKYGYEKDPIAARELNESLVKKEDQEAIKRKFEGLVEGKNSYAKDPLAARELNESLVEKEDQEAIKRKIEGLVEGKYGYEKDPVAAKGFIESLLMSINPAVRAVGKYIKALAMKYGVSELGYTRESKKALEFIKENHVPY